MADAQLGGIDVDGVAGFEEDSVPLGDAQPEHEGQFADRGDGVAVQHHRSWRDRNGQHAAGDRGQYLALFHVLQQHLAFGDAGTQRIGRDIFGRACLIHHGFRTGALPEQCLGPRQIHASLRELRLKPRDLRVERADLQRQLFVADHRDHLILDD